MCLVASMKMMEGCIPKRFEFCRRDDLTHRSIKIVQHSWIFSMMVIWGLVQTDDVIKE
jgi:hypothetical protein